MLQVCCPRGKPLSLGLAERFGQRLAGLVGLPGLPPGQGIVLPRCRSVHTAGMRFAVDVVFVGWPPDPHGALEVARVRERVRPFRVVSCPGRARELAVIELEAGGAAAGAIAPGVTLVASPRLPR